MIKTNTRALRMAPEKKSMVKKQTHALLASSSEEMVASAEMFISEEMVLPAKMVAEEKERHG